MEIILTASYNLPALAESGGLRKGLPTHQVPNKDESASAKVSHRDDDGIASFTAVRPSTVSSDAVAGHKRCSFRASFPLKDLLAPKPAGPSNDLGTDGDDVAGVSRASVDAGPPPLLPPPRRLVLEMGRDPRQCDLVIPFALGSGPLLSRRHCSLSVALADPYESHHDENADAPLQKHGEETDALQQPALQRGCVVFIEDHGSLNGTFVDNEKIRTSTPTEEVFQNEDTVTRGKCIYIDLATDVALAHGREPVCTLSFGGGSRVVPGEELPDDQLALRFHVFLRVLTEQTDLRSAQPAWTWWEALATALRGSRRPPEVEHRHCRPVKQRGPSEEGTHAGGTTATQNSSGKGNESVNEVADKESLDKAPPEVASGHGATEKTSLSRATAAVAEPLPPPPVAPTTPFTSDSHEAIRPPPPLPPNRSSIDALLHSVMVQHQSIAGDGMSVSARSSGAASGPKAPPLPPPDAHPAPEEVGVTHRIENAEEEGQRSSHAPDDTKPAVAEAGDGEAPGLEEPEPRDPIPQENPATPSQPPAHRTTSSVAAKNTRMSDKPTTIKADETDMDAIFQDAEPILLVRTSDARRSSGGVPVPVVSPSRLARGRRSHPCEEAHKCEALPSEEAGLVVPTEANPLHRTSTGSVALKKPSGAEHFTHELPRRRSTSHSNPGDMSAWHEGASESAVHSLPQTPSFSSYQPSQWENDAGALPRVTTTTAHGSRSAALVRDDTALQRGEVEENESLVGAGLDACVLGRMVGTTVYDARTSERLSSATDPRASTAAVPSTRKRFIYRNGVLAYATDRPSDRAGAGNDAEKDEEEEVIEVECTPNVTRPSTPPTPPVPRPSTRYTDNARQGRELPRLPSPLQPLQPTTREMPSLTDVAVAARGKARHSSTQAAARKSKGKKGPSASETVARFVSEIQGITVPVGEATRDSKGKSVAQERTRTSRGSEAQEKAKTEAPRSSLAVKNEAADGEDLALDAGLKLNKDGIPHKASERDPEHLQGRESSSLPPSQPHESLLLRYQRQKREEKEKKEKEKERLTMERNGPTKGGQEGSNASERPTVELSPRSTHGAILRATLLPPSRLTRDSHPNSNKRVSFPSTKATHNTTNGECVGTGPGHAEEAEDDPLVVDLLSQPLSQVEPAGWFGSQSQLVFIPTQHPNCHQQQRVFVDAGEEDCPVSEHEAFVPSARSTWACVESSVASYRSQSIQDKDCHDDDRDKDVTGSAFSQYAQAGLAFHAKQQQQQRERLEVARRLSSTRGRGGSRGKKKSAAGDAPGPLTSFLDSAAMTQQRLLLCGEELPLTRATDTGANGPPHEQEKGTHGREATSISTASSAGLTSTATGALSVPSPSIPLVLVLPKRIPQRRLSLATSAKKAPTTGRRSATAQRQERLSMLFTALTRHSTTPSSTRKHDNASRKTDEAANEAEWWAVRRVASADTPAPSSWAMPVAHLDGADEEEEEQQRGMKEYCATESVVDVGTISDFDPAFTTAHSRLVNPSRHARRGQPALFARAALCTRLFQHQFEGVRFLWSRLMREAITESDLPETTETTRTPVASAANVILKGAGRHSGRPAKNPKACRGYNPFVTPADVQTRMTAGSVKKTVSSDLQESMSDFALPHLFLTCSQLTHAKGTAAAEVQDSDGEQSWIPKRTATRKGAKRTQDTVAESSRLSPLLSFDATIPRGCVLAHAAGSGKTCTVIAFLLCLWSFERLHTDGAHSPPAFQEFCTPPTASPILLSSRATENSREVGSPARKGARTVIAVPRAMQLAHWAQELGRWPRDTGEACPITVFVLDAERAPVAHSERSEGEQRTDGNDDAQDDSSTGLSAAWSLLNRWATAPADRTVLLTTHGMLATLLKDSAKEAQTTERDARKAADKKAKRTFPGGGRARVKGAESEHDARLSMHESFWQDDEADGASWGNASSVSSRSFDASEEGKEDRKAHGGATVSTVTRGKRAEKPQTIKRQRREDFAKGCESQSVLEGETLLGVDDSAEDEEKANTARKPMTRENPADHTLRAACGRLLLDTCTLLIVDEAERIGGTRSFFSRALAAFPPVTLRLALTDSSNLVLPLLRPRVPLQDWHPHVRRRPSAHVRHLFPLLHFVMPALWRKPADLNGMLAEVATSTASLFATPSLPPAVRAIAHVRTASQLTRSVSVPEPPGKKKSLPLLPQVVETTLVIDFSPLQSSLFRELTLCMSEPDSTTDDHPCTMHADTAVKAAKALQASDKDRSEAARWCVPSHHATTFVSRTLLISNHCELVQDWCHRQGIDARSTSEAVEAYERSHAKRDSVAWALPSFLVPSVFDEEEGSDVMGAANASSVPKRTKKKTPRGKTRDSDAGQDDVVDTSPSSLTSSARIVSLQHSWKMRVLLHLLRASLWREEKVVVLSHSLPSLVLVGLLMQRASGFTDGEDFAMLSTSLSVRRRAELCELFNDPSSSLHVLLLPFPLATSLAPELTGADRLLFLDPSCDAVTEAKALGCVRRLPSDGAKIIYVNRLLSNNPAELQDLSVNRLADAAAVDVDRGSHARSCKRNTATSGGVVGAGQLLQDLSSFSLLASDRERHSASMQTHQRAQPRPTLTRTSIGVFKRQQDLWNEAKARSRSTSPAPTPLASSSHTCTRNDNRRRRQRRSSSLSPPSTQSSRTPSPAPTHAEDEGKHISHSPLFLTEHVLQYLDCAVQRRLERADASAQEGRRSSLRKRGKHAGTTHPDGQDPVVSEVQAANAELSFAIAACFPDPRFNY